MYDLSIELKGPVCAASGAGGPGYIDRDVVFTEEGIPYLPGRRLKGLLRDAFRDIGDALGYRDADASKWKVEDWLFGKTGDTVPGVLRVGNGMLCARGDTPVDSSLTSWLRAAREIANPHHVATLFTEVRRQTSILRETGGAKKDTLRATRVLRAGLRFRAPLTPAMALPEECESMLALAAAALQRMGTSRTRGLGRVSCRLLRGDQDLTSVALSKLRSEQLQPPAFLPALSASGSAAKVDGPAGGTMVLRYRLTLREPALLAGLEGDPNQVATLNYIAGSSVQGLFAWRYLQTHPTDAIFFSLFCRGRLRFLPAYPEEEHGWRLLPAPYALRQPKGDETLYINALAAETVETQNTRRIDRNWTLPVTALSHEELRMHETALGMEYHHARPAGDRRVGRALNAEQIERARLDTAPGAVFSYEYLKAGQVFQGAVCGDAAALEFLRGLTADEGVQVAIGRSRNGQFGGDASLTWISQQPLPIEKEGGEVASWSDPGLWSRAVETDQLLLLALSPVLGYHETTGHPSAELPIAEVALLTGLKIVCIQRAFTRAAWSGGYLSHQRLPTQQLPCIEAGSVFLLKLTQPVSPEAQEQAAKQAMIGAVGFRTEQGFGRIALLPATGMCERGRITSFHADQMSMEAPDGAARVVAVELFRTRLRDSVIGEALRVSSDAKMGRGVTPGLLLRLSQDLKSLEGLAPRLAKYRKKARLQLEVVRIQGLPFMTRDRDRKIRSLDEFLADTASGRLETFRTLLKKSLTEKWQIVFGRHAVFADESQEATVCVALLLDVMLRSLARRIRAERKQPAMHGARS